MSAPLATAIEGLTQELAAQRRGRERTPEFEAETEAKRRPLVHVGRKGVLGLLVRLPGWERAFTRIPAPPLEGEVLLCTCGAQTPLADSQLVPCDCHRWFLLHEGEVFVCYGEEKRDA